MGARISESASRQISCGEDATGRRPARPGIVHPKVGWRVQAKVLVTEFVCDSLNSHSRQQRNLWPTKRTSSRRASPANGTWITRACPATPAWMKRPIFSSTARINRTSFLRNSPRRRKKSNARNARLRFARRDPSATTGNDFNFVIVIVILFAILACCGWDEGIRIRRTITITSF
jgi:hypothetical protein